MISIEANLRHTAIKWARLSPGSFFMEMICQPKAKKKNITEL